MTPSGDVVCAAIPESANYADREWFITALSTQEFVFGGYELDRASKRPVVTVAYPVLDETGRVQAVLYAAIDIGWLEGAFQAVFLPEGAALFVVDHAGIVLADLGWPEDLIGKPCPLLLALQGLPTLLETMGPDGRTWLYVAHPFASGITGMAHVVVAMPAVLAYAHAREHLFWGVLVVMLVGAGAGAFAWAWGERFIRRPAENLVRLAQRLGTGDFRVRTGLRYDRTEFGRLAEALDTAAQNLAEAEEKRAALEQSLVQLVQVSPVILYALNPADFSPTWVSPNIREILGYTPEEALEPGWWQAHLHPEDRALAIREIPVLLEKGHLVQEYRFSRKDGQWIWVRDELRVVRDAAGRPVQIVGAWTDITLRKEAEAKLEEQVRILSALYAGAQRLTAALVEKDLAEEVCRTCVEAFGLSLAWVGLAEESGVVSVIGQFPPDHPYPRAIRVRWDETPEGQGPTGRAIRAGQPQVVEDILTDPRYESWRPLAQTYGFRSSAAFPLISRGRVFAALNLYSSVPSFFTKERLELFQALANQTAGAFANARLFAETQRQLKRVQALRHIDLAITGSLDPRITLRVLLEEVTGQLGVDAAAVFLFDPNATVLRCTQVRGFRNPKALEELAIPISAGYLGEAVLQRQITQAHGPQIVEGFPKPVREMFLVEGFVSAYAAPMVAKGRVLGVLGTFHRTPSFGNSDWLGLLEALAGQAAIAIDNARLFSDLEQANLELRLAYDATLEALAKALEYRDLETKGHSQRVTELTLKLARKLGMPEEELVHVRRGALLHDIGKLAIPDSILLKPGKLTEEEWAIMRKHPEYAYEMLSFIPYLRPALDIPYCHHERWDGKGYPRGLKGEEIPLAARIFAVVDAWDAMTSDRPYRKALSTEEALAEIEKGAGTQFDPKVVVAFLELIREG